MPALPAVPATTGGESASGLLRGQLLAALGPEAAPLGEWAPGRVPAAARIVEYTAVDQRGRVPVVLQAASFDLASGRYTNRLTGAYRLLADALPDMRRAVQDALADPLAGAVRIKARRPDTFVAGVARQFRVAQVAVDASDAPSLAAAFAALDPALRANAGSPVVTPGGAQ